MLMSEDVVVFGPGEGTVGLEGAGAGAPSWGLAWHAVVLGRDLGASGPGFVPALQEGAVI